MQRFATLSCSILLLAQCQSAVAKPTPQTDATADSTRRPNVVFIMADELGYYELSCMGHPHIRTPNIDRMAARGVRFTQCLAGSPLCAPTRATLLTGKHSGHTSVRTNGGGTPLRLEEPTIGSVLKAAGYATGGFGKWGCGGRGSTGVPEKHGFDVFVGYYDQVHAHTYFPAYLVRNSEELPLAGNKGGRKGETYAHYVIVDEAKKFIRANKDRPFFCYMPVTPPHGMFDIPDSDPAWALYEDRDWPVEARRYAAMVTMLDRQVGEVLKLLEELGLEDDTLVMFGGDNGGNDYFKSGEHRRGFHAPNVDPKTKVEFRGTKGRVYEGGLRVPMIAYWPGRIAPGRVSEHLAYFPDLMPTFAEIASAKVPDDIDGISMVPTLLGEEAAGRKQAQHRYLYWELGPQRAVREGHWKAVRTGRNAKWSLYDLANDVSEAHDVSGEHAEVLARLRAYAQEAHTPAVEGSFADRSLHEKDRRARGTPRRNRGGRRGRASNQVNRLPESGVLARNGWKIVRVSSQNEANGKVVTNILDGNPRSHWHTRFGDQRASHPHEVVIDMGAPRDVRGIVYLARQDRAWNGALAKCEIFVGDQVDTLSAQKAHAVTFAKKKTAQRVEIDPVRGRYLMLRVLSEVNGGPWASIAELGVLGDVKRR